MQVIVGRGLVKIEKGEVLVLVDTAELPKAYNEFFLTVPPLSDKQMGAIMGNRNFIRESCR